MPLDTAPKVCHDPSPGGQIKRYTPMQETEELLKRAWDAVEASKLPEHVQGVALRIAAGHLAADVRAAASPRAAARSGDSQASSFGADSGMLARIAQKLKADEETVSRVFNQNGDDLELVVAFGRLERTNTGATKQIATLVVAGRQAAGLEEWTSAAVVRGWCEQFKKLDSNNFASTLRQLENLFTFRGSPQARFLKATAPGWERAGELVRQLGGPE